ncbi:MAG: DUF4346 domain-containing protein [Cyanobacteria bacterium]|nr:DUF4346 domain-containing protein [Cyanobacteriota bacterium]
MAPFLNPALGCDSNNGSDNHNQTSPLCVAVCTLADDPLKDRLSQMQILPDLLVGALHTENLGIEQIITYCLSNPQIRYLLLCGLDGSKAIGHLPGQSLMALYENGIDDNGTMIGAQGKRPVIQNLSVEAIEHFRSTVSVLNFIGLQDPETIRQHVLETQASNPGPAPRFDLAQNVSVFQRDFPLIQGYKHAHMISDPGGYVIIYTDLARKIITLEHYDTAGCLQRVIEGDCASQIYTPLLELDVITRLDHAAYIGRELARAEQCIDSQTVYVQDALETALEETLVRSN